MPDFVFKLSTTRTKNIENETFRRSREQARRKIRQNVQSKKTYFGALRGFSRTSISMECPWRSKRTSVVCPRLFIPMGCPCRLFEQTARELPTAYPWPFRGHFVVCLWDVRGRWQAVDCPVRGCTRTVLGLPTGCPWAARGLFMGFPWASRERPVGCTVGFPRAVHGLPVACPWAASGMPEGRPWDVRRLPMNCLRAIVGLPLGCSWTAHSLFVGFCP